MGVLNIAIVFQLWQSLIIQCLTLLVMSMFEPPVNTDHIRTLIFHTPALPHVLWSRFMLIIDDLRKSRGLNSVSAYGHGPVYIGPGLRV